MRDSNTYDDEEHRIRERLRAKLDSRTDDEHRIRERLRAKLDNRNRNQPNSNSTSNNNSGMSPPAGTVEKNDNSLKDTKTDYKTDNIEDSKQSRRRRRRHRVRRNRVAGPPHPFRPPSYASGPPYRGSRSPPNHLGPPPGPFGPGYGAPPGPYGGAYHPPFGGPPPPYGYDWRGPRGPPIGRYGGSVDDFGRRLPPRRTRSRSRSSSRSSYQHRRSRSYSRSGSRSVDRRRPRSRSRSVSSSGSSSSSGSMSSSASSRTSNKTKSTQSSRSSSSRSISDDESKSSTRSEQQDKQDPYTKDQRTVFVTQLVLRTTEKDIAKFFRKEGIKTNEVILLRDKRTGRHKGSAYVEMRRMDDVIKSLGLSGKPPDFQRFPILIKASEAEKNYILNNKAQIVLPQSDSPAVILAKPIVPAIAQPLISQNGKLIQAQKLYVGNLDPSVSQEHLFALFKPFGQLEQVTIQKNESGVSKGFAFLQFRDAKEANLALQTMSGQILAGRPIKTGWASQVSANPNVEVVTSQEFPLDATNRAQNAYLVLAQLTNASVAVQAAVVSAATHQDISASSGMSRVPTVADARASLAAQGNAGLALPQQPKVFGALPSNVLTNVVTIDPMKIGNSENPSKTLLVHNMFNKDEETDPGWENDIQEEFREECSKYGTIISVKVMHTEPGGKIYATFDSITGAKNCASNLAGRWFDKRQLRVEYVSDALASA